MTALAGLKRIDFGAPGDFFCTYYVRMTREGFVGRGAQRSRREPHPIHRLPLRCTRRRGRNIFTAGIHMYASMGYSTVMNKTAV